MAATPSANTTAATASGPTRALRLISFVYMLGSLALALLSLAGGDGATTGTVLTTLFVGGQGVLVWALCAVLCMIADDIRAYTSSRR